jgi:hypothetical protein
MVVADPIEFKPSNDTRADWTVFSMVALRLAPTFNEKAVKCVCDSHRPNEEMKNKLGFWHPHGEPNSNDPWFECRECGTLACSIFCAASNANKHRTECNVQYDDKLLKQMYLYVTPPKSATVVSEGAGGV